MRPARPVRHSDPADLARNQSQATTMKSTAQWNCHRRVTIPAKFEYARFVACESKSSTKSSCAAARVEDQIAVVLRSVGRSKANTKLLSEFGALSVDIDECSLDADETATQECNKRADPPGADNCNPVCRSGRRIPHGIEGRLHIGSQHGSPRRHGFGQGHNGALRNIEVVLMRVERENSTAEMLLRTILDPTHGRVPVFYRKRKTTTHKRRAHALELALWHPAGENQRLSPSAQRAEKRAYAYLARLRRRQYFLTDLRLSWCDVPERLSCVGRHEGWGLIGLLRHLLCYIIKFARSFRD